tara:strand:- start:299 stop:571 length:273 start_codon:yes stop_codon:yes gene_type:complete
MKGDRLYQWNIDRRSSKEISEADARLERQNQKELKEVERLYSLVMEEAPSLDALKKIAKGLNVYLSHLFNDNDRDWNKYVDNKLKDQRND